MELRGAETELRKARIISLLHSRIIRQAVAGLVPVLSRPGIPEASDPQAAVESAVERAQEAIERLRRLEDLLLRQKGQLEQASKRVGPALKEQRSMNREIARLQAEFPGLLEPLLDGATATPQARRKAAAGISILAGRAEALMPQAEKAQAALEEARLVLDVGLERCRLWTEAWREAGKSERQLREPGPGPGGGIPAWPPRRPAEASDGAVDSLAPVMEALSPLCLLDLAPTLAATAQKIAGLKHSAGKLKLKSATLTARMPGHQDPQPGQASGAAQAVLRHPAPPERQAGGGGRVAGAVQGPPPIGPTWPPGPWPRRSSGRPRKWR